jgi:hypothetical protein
MDNHSLSEESMSFNGQLEEVLRRISGNEKETQIVCELWMGLSSNIFGIRNDEYFTPKGLLVTFSPTSYYDIRECDGELFSKRGFIEIDRMILIYIMHHLCGHLDPMFRIFSQFFTAVKYGLMRGITTNQSYHWVWPRCNIESILDLAEMNMWRANGEIPAYFDLHDIFKDTLCLMLTREFPLIVSDGSKTEAYLTTKRCVVRSESSHCWWEYEGLGYNLYRCVGVRQVAEALLCSTGKLRDSDCFNFDYQIQSSSGNLLAMECKFMVEKLSERCLKLVYEERKGYGIVHPYVVKSILDRYRDQLITPNLNYQFFKGTLRESVGLEELVIASRNPIWGHKESNTIRVCLCLVCPIDTDGTYWVNVDFTTFEHKSQGNKCTAGLLYHYCYEKRKMIKKNLTPSSMEWNLFRGNIVCAIFLNEW